MDSFANGALLGGVIGTVVGALGMLSLRSIRLRPRCPDCNEPLPRLRKPANLTQALWGGWTCGTCGCELDGRGRKLRQA